MRATADGDRTPVWGRWTAPQLGVIAAILALVLGAAGIGIIVQRLALDSGVIVSAVVISVEDLDTRVPVLVVKPVGAASQTGNLRVTKFSTSPVPAVGDHIQVQYLPSGPNNAVEVGQRGWAWNALLCLLGFLLFGTYAVRQIIQGRRPLAC